MLVHFPMPPTAIDLESSQADNDSHTRQQTRLHHREQEVEQEPLGNDPTASRVPARRPHRSAHSPQPSCLSATIPYILTHAAGITALVLYTVPQVVRAVNVVWGATARRTHAVGEVLCAAAQTSDCRGRTRTAFACLGRDVQTNQCIARLLKPDPNDVR